MVILLLNNCIEKVVGPRRSGTWRFTGISVLWGFGTLGVVVMAWIM